MNYWRHGNAGRPAVEPRGHQQATTTLVPRGRRDPDAVKLAQHIGMGLDPWQADMLSDITAMSGNHYAAFECAAIIPRQNGKTYLIIARALAGALLYDEKLILYSAHEYRTAQETWRILRDLCESYPLKDYVKRLRLVAGGEAVEFHNGARFKLMARTRTSGRGFSPDSLLLDEAFALSDDVMASVLPSMAARTNPQVCYFSSAGTWESTVLLGLRRRGHAKASRRLAYWEWHADPSADHGDPAVWASANPGYGIRLSREAVERERESMAPRAFARERLGIWSESAVESVLREQDIRAVESPPPPADGRPVGWGVDVAHDRTGSAICAAFRDDVGNAVLVLVDARPGAGWLPERLASLVDTYEAEFAYDARGGILDLMERAERDYDVPVIPLKYKDYPAACANLAQRVAEGTVLFGAAPALLADAHSASARHTISGWVWDRHVVTPPTHIIAATCALSALERNDGGMVAVY